MNAKMNWKKPCTVHKTNYISLYPQQKPLRFSAAINTASWTRIAPQISEHFTWRKQRPSDMFLIADFVLTLISREQYLCAPPNQVRPKEIVSEE